MESNDDWRLSLRITIPSDTCDCHDGCICREYVKCFNNCFCGNTLQKKFQHKSMYGAQTPDYRNANRLSYKVKKHSVSFGNIDIHVMSPFKCLTPRYLWIKEKNKMYKNRFLSPQESLKKFNIKPITPLSV